jgi:AraC-like DNA-binding protein
MMILSGPWLVPLTVAIVPGDRYAGIRLQPGAVGPMLGVDPTTLRDRSVAAHQLAPTLVTAVGGILGAADSITPASARLDALLLPESRHWATPDPLVQEAVRHLTDSEGEMAIGELARTLSVSPRTLRRRFVAATGLAPKQFARIRRLLAAAWRMAQGGESWGRVAAEAGFADQPHLTREMVDLTGLTPGAFGARVRSTEHDDVVP